MTLLLLDGPLDGKGYEIHKSYMKDGNELIALHGGHQREHELVYVVVGGKAVFSAERTAERLEDENEE